MKKQIIKSMVVGTLVGVSVLSVNAYNTSIWDPVQYVKQLFATPNGEIDSSKATIKIDGTNGRIDAKSVYADNLYKGGKKVATEDYVDSKLSNVKISLPKCSNGYVLTSYDGKDFKCVEAGSITKKLYGKCGSIKNQCIQGVYQDINDDSNYYKWRCVGLNGGNSVNCSVHKPIYGQCGSSKYTCSKGIVSNIGTNGNYYTWICKGQYGGNSVNCSKSKSITIGTFSGLTPVSYGIGKTSDGYYVVDGSKVSRGCNDSHIPNKSRCIVKIGSFYVAPDSTETYRNHSDAIRYCNNLNVAGKSNWYLPSLNELRTMYNNKSKIYGLASGYYWSSTHYTSGRRRLWHMGCGRDYGGRRSDSGYYRCLSK